MRILRIAMAQMNPKVGDIAGNTRAIKRWLKEARKAKADVVAFPELAVTGYPPEDLLLKPRFVADNLRALDEIAKDCKGILAVIGHVGQGQAGNGKSRRWVVSAGQYELTNAAALNPFGSFSISRRSERSSSEGFNSGMETTSPFQCLQYRLDCGSGKKLNPIWQWLWISRKRKRSDGESLRYAPGRRWICSRWAQSAGTGLGS